MSRLRCSGAKSITVDEVTSLRVCAECVKLRRVAGQRSRDHFFGKSSAANQWPLVSCAQPVRLCRANGDRRATPSSVNGLLRTDSAPREYL
jgi:hypothetical protein